MRLLCGFKSLSANIAKLPLIGSNRRLRIGVLGNSNSVRKVGYVKYVCEKLSDVTSRTIVLDSHALGGVRNLHAIAESIREPRLFDNDLILYEYCPIDRYGIEHKQYSLDLAGKSLEGFIRKARVSSPNCILVVLIFGLNTDEYYHEGCKLTKLYHSICEHYRTVCIDVGHILIKKRGLDFLRTLYNSDVDDTHYTIPEGVQIVAETIVNEFKKRGIINKLKLPSSKFNQTHNATLALPSPIYEDHFQDLKLLDPLQPFLFKDKKAKKNFFVNSAYQGTLATLYQGTTLHFSLKGKLIALFIKSDMQDGFFKVNFGDESIVTSSFSSWVNPVRPRNSITLSVLPESKFISADTFTDASISLCEDYPQEFEMDLFKIEPKEKDKKKWNLNIIGIAYLGEIRPISE